MADEEPQYRVHRARRGVISKLLFRGNSDRFSDIEQGDRSSGRGSRARRDRFDPLNPERVPEAEPRTRKPITPWRVVKWILLTFLAWTLLSIVLFFVSAHIQSTKVPKSTKAALDGSGNMLTSANNILVLGSDKRKRDGSGHGRADTIMMMRYGGGHSARLSIPRDTLVDIPGYGRTKVNAAYALGGAPLMINTIKQYLGVEVNHIVEINFKGFPKFIDSMGGVDFDLDNCIRSNFEGRNVHFKKGEQHLDGQQALDVARVRKNECSAAENDLTRAARQQQLLNSIKSRMYSPFLIPRWPWVAWRAPQAIQSDLGGSGLMSLFWDVQASGSPKPQVLKPSAFVGGALEVSDAEKQAKVDQFLKK